MPTLFSCHYALQMPFHGECKVLNCFGGNLLPFFHENIFQRFYVLDQFSMGLKCGDWGRCGSILLTLYNNHSLAKLKERYRNRQVCPNFTARAFKLFLRIFKYMNRPMVNSMNAKFPVPFALKAPQTL